MRLKRAGRGFSYIELLIAISLMGIVLLMTIPRGDKTRGNLSSKMVAEQLQARVRQIRQTALSKGIPVALAIPRNSTHNYSDTALQLEGETNPRVTNTWKIEQDRPSVVFFVGQWAGPSWGNIPSLAVNFDLTNWWTGTRPAEADFSLFSFSGTGALSSNVPGCDGGYRILVAQGLDASRDTLNKANSPWTVSIFPTGDCSVSQGAWGAATIPTNNQVDTPTGVTYSTMARGTNHDPVIVKSAAYPDAVNPAGTGKIMDLSSNLGLEVRVKDQDGDPPYFLWNTPEAYDDANKPLATGGTYAHPKETRMEWDPATQEWVGRTNWTPDIGDKGGGSYLLTCTVRDHRGGTTTTKFPVNGYLHTTKEPWVLYRTLTKNNHWELWKATISGEEHQKVASFPNQDIIFGQWTPSGQEVVLATRTGIYRAKADGSAIQQVPTNAFAGQICACAMSPGEESLLYIACPPTGNYNVSIRNINWNANGVATETSLCANGDWKSNYNLSSANIGGSSVFVWNYYDTWKPFLASRRHFYGGMVAQKGVPVPPGHPSDTYTGLTNTGNQNQIMTCGQNRNVTYGLSISDDGSELLYGGPAGITIASVSYLGGPSSMTSSPINVIPTPGYNDVHHPRYIHTATQRKKGIVFGNGRGAASRMYVIKDLTSPSTILEIPLPTDGSQFGAEEPTVSPPQ